MQSPIRWFGGKGNMVAKILPLFPACQTYVEAFGGGASLLFAKRPSPVEVYNDLDGGLVNFFRVLRHPARFRRFLRQVRSTPYARQEYDDARATWRAIDDPVDRAVAWFVVARMSFSGAFGASWGSVVTASRRGMAETVSAWLNGVDALPEIHRRLMRVQIEQSDWRVILDRYDTPETLFYCDPPYVHETRSAGGYDHELSREDHAELVERLLKLEGMVVLSGYDHPVYDRLTEAEWARHEFKTACHAAPRTRASGILGDGAALAMQPRTEVVWESPTCRLNREGRSLWEV